MGNALRETGIDLIGDVPWGTHFCQFYDTKEDLIDILVPYFKAGLESNEFCMWVTSEPLGVEGAKKALEKVLPNINDYLESGQLEILPYTEWYVQKGEFESDRVLNGWVEKLNIALYNGFDGLRLTGNTFWLEKESWDDFVDYEKAVDSVIGNYQMIAICTYCLDKCNASEIIDVVNNHQFALIKREGEWTLFESSKQKKLDEELKATKDRYDTLFNNMLDGYAHCEMIHDKQGNPVDFIYLNVNKAFEMLTGLADVEGKKVSEAIPGIKESHPELFEIYGRVASTGEPERLEIEFKPLDIWFNIAVFSPQKNHFIAIFENVTESKKTEVMLIENRERLNLAQKVSNVGIFEWNIPTGVNIWTPELEAMYGLQEGEFPGTQEAWEELIHPEDMPDALRLVDLALETGEPVEGEWRVIWPDGSLHWLFGRWKVFKDEYNKPLKMIGVNMDVTRHKNAEEALEADLVALKNLHNLSNLYLHDENWEQVLIEIVNSAVDISGSDFGNIQLLDAKSSQLKIVAYKGFPKWWLDYWDTVSKGQGTCGTALEKKQRVIVEDVANSPIFSGETLDMQLNAGVRAIQSTPVMSRSGKPLGMFSTHYKTPHRPGKRELQLLDLLARQVADIIQNKKAEDYRKEMLEKEQQLSEELQTTNEELQTSNTDLIKIQDELRKTIKKLEISNIELEQFAYVASHDLQEPLRMVSSFSQLLEKRYKDRLDKDADEFIEFIVEGANRMKDLIDDLLAFSRLNTKKKDFHFTDLNQLLDNVLLNMKSTIEEEDAHITRDNLPIIFGDPSQISQVFQNLISNSIKFHQTPPQIHVSAEEKDNEWIIGVSDEGIGIHPEHQQKIFDVFKRLHTREEYVGTGIGLSICKRIIERHKGRIWVESEPKKGANFYFTIPKIEI